MKANSLGRISEDMTTKEVFEAWDVLQDYVRAFSAVVNKHLVECVRRNDFPGVDVTEEMAEEQRHLWDICDVLRSMGVM